ncbi:MAG: hypothetical protein JRJ40_09710, partial [Deltaproteobacteria bacterium]|nr:hypothetical protein [Deltaproteobacteria bacterium]
MSHDVGNDTGGGGILANKILWLIVGASIFVLVGFVLPTPQSVIDIVDKYGFANKLIDWEVATDLPNAARKTMIVLGLIP